MVIHLFAALLAPLAVRAWGRRAFWVLAMAPASAFIWALAHTSALDAGIEVSYPWAPVLHLSLDLRLDGLSWLMVLLIGGIGAAVMVYSSRYFSATASGLGRFAAVLTGFAGAMLGLVLADNLLLLYVFWELTTILSYLLIGHSSDIKASRRAAMQALVVTSSGGLVMLVGLIMLGSAGGTYRISELVAHPPSGTVVTVAICCILLGAICKSAQVPFHFWLPGAMAAPTPVSAYLHAAAMVKAGIYLIARFAPGYSELPAWRITVLCLGTLTLLVGGYRALRQHDAKLLLAYGTVSQLGLLVVLVGAGGRSAALAGLALLGAHAMFKSALFLAVGAVDAAAGTRDLRKLSGVGRARPVLATAAAVATASMIAIPPTAGYVAKEAAITSLLHGEAVIGTRALDAIMTLAIVAGSILTTAYGLRLWWGAFATKPGIHTKVRRVSRLLIAPPVVLAAASVAAGVVPALGQRILAPYAATYPAGEVGHLALVAGGATMAISALILVCGIAVFAARESVERLQNSLVLGPEMDRVYRSSMRRLDRGAGWVTAATQRGSLPIYLGIIMMTTCAFAIVCLLSGMPSIQWRVWDSPVQLLVGLLAVAAAILAIRARRRLKAVILLGISGYATAMLFALYGAPDLALTQVLVETVILVVFVLVMRRLPPYFSDRPLPASRWLRAGAALVVGATVSVLALAAPAVRHAPPVSELFAQEALAFGYGHNIVNVTLVDIRAWDTMGEISVLLVAATGVASLVFLSRRSGRILRARDAKRSVWGGVPDPAGQLRRRHIDRAQAEQMVAARGGRAAEWLRGVRTIAPARRSVIFEVVTRLLFHPMLVFSVYLLLSGHNAPGGGFAAGLMAGIALIVRYLAGGRYELGEAAPVHPGWLLGTGLFLSAGVGLAGLAFGAQILQSTVVDLTIPLVGTVHVVTSLFFDIGVYLVVIGLMLDVLRSLGAEVDRQGEHAGTAAPDIAHDSPQRLADELAQATRRQQS